MLINSFLVFFRFHEPFEVSFYEITQDNFTQGNFQVFNKITKSTSGCLFQEGREVGVSA